MTAPAGFQPVTHPDICRSCATGNGGRGGEDSWKQAGVCEWCGEVRLLTAFDDWDWNSRLVDR